MLTMCRSLRPYSSAMSDKKGRMQAIKGLLKRKHGIDDADVTGWAATEIGEYAPGRKQYQFSHEEYGVAKSAREAAELQAGAHAAGEDAGADTAGDGAGGDEADEDAGSAGGRSAAKSARAAARTPKNKGGGGGSAAAARTLQLMSRSDGGGGGGGGGDWGLGAAFSRAFAHHQRQQHELSAQIHKLTRRQTAMQATVLANQTRVDNTVVDMNSILVAMSQRLTDMQQDAESEDDGIREPYAPHPLRYDDGEEEDEE
ncbi:hypothetical protein JKP88DRAFT_325846 [Tribonema minus]|uniref:Uncharacterized protein n=1 Tax=Tribonema minus TaxID=303371 RepID=A0A835YRG0_9STRA|nr:hypothetical protein JKP88DRAFT_325846 [Tribonema minus]